MCDSRDVKLEEVKTVIEAVAVLHLRYQDKNGNEMKLTMEIEDSCLQIQTTRFPLKSRREVKFSGVVVEHPPRYYVAKNPRRKVAHAQ